MVNKVAVGLLLGFFLLACNSEEVSNELYGNKQLIIGKWKKVESRTIMSADGSVRVINITYRNECEKQPYIQFSEEGRYLSVESSVSSGGACIKQEHSYGYNVSEGKLTIDGLLYKEMEIVELTSSRLELQYGIEDQDGDEKPEVVKVTYTRI